MANESIKLNLIPSGEMPVFHCSQFDNGRPIIIELYNGEDAYELPSGYTAELHCRKVDNNIVTLASELVNTNVVTFISTTQLCACNGKNLCEVAIKDASDYLIGTLNFWLEVEMDPLKGGINSTSEIHDLYEQIEEITAEVIGDDYYDKTEVDNLLDDKADKSTTYTKTQVDTLLTSKADKSNVYTKSESDALLADKADADDVYTKAQVETKLAAKADAADVYTKDETDTLLDAKANANAVYSKVEVDGIVDDLEDAIALKANSSDVYTKIQVDNIILDIMPVDTAGPAAIASFDTDLAVNLVDVKTTLTPSLTGYTKVNLTRCGVNLWDEVWEATTTRINSKNLIPVKPNTTYGWKSPVQPSNGLRFYAQDGTTLLSTVYSVDNFNNGFGTFITPNDCYYVWFALSGSYGTTYNHDVSINYPSTRHTTYHAYTGNAYAIALGDTYYGGTLDVTTGVLTVEYDSSLQPITPYDVQLIPVQIAAIVGHNNVFSDTGDTTVKYKEGIQHYIDKKVST